MKAKDRRELYRQEATQRHNENYSSLNDSGKFRDIYIPEKKAGMKLWRCKEDDHEIYIVPYVTGKKHPRLPEGRSDFVLNVFVHRGVGINEDSYICLNRTFKQRCPICEYQAELRENENVDEDEVKALNPTKRSIYNIVCVDTPKDEEKGVQVFDVSHYLFTVPLEEMAHKKKGGGEVPYAHIDMGKIISFRKKGSKRNTEFTAFEFKVRDEIPDEVLDAAVCLDEQLYIPTYEEVHEAFFESKGKEAAPEPERSAKEEKTEDTERKPKNTEKDVPESVTSKASDKGKVEECPSGAVFGTDYNVYEECRSCDVRRDCRDKKDELDEQEKTKKELAEAARKAAEKSSSSEATSERKKLTRREK
ncbi:MAG: hypothetical protein WC346_00035 [Methanogenium sp.]|jgi:hypothetical protein